MMTLLYMSCKYNDIVMYLGEISCHHSDLERSEQNTSMPRDFRLPCPKQTGLKMVPSLFTPKTIEIQLLDSIQYL